ncbi:MAG: M13 family metallopeptidase [Elusimicrobia bacterium]|nr:M13 family metallopeptidase [Elusimicrobiota bacterium]
MKAIALSLLLAVPAAAVPRGVEPAVMDLTIKPCDDFYRYACGGWMKANPIPGDQSRWGRFNELAERNKAILKGLLEAAAAKPKDDADRRAGGLYASCVDEAAAETAGVKPIAALLAEVDALASAADLPPLLARMHRRGVNAGFGYGSEQDFKNSAKVIAGLDQAGLGLPDRDYYLKGDAKSADIRKAYEWHAARSFGLAGDSPAAAAARAAAVMRVETALAKASMDRVLRRDPANVYHKKPRAGLAKLAPDFGWEAYFAAAGGPAWKEVNVASPDFMAAFSRLLTEAPLSDVKDYLRWRALSSAAPLLDRALVEESFDFFGRRLTGAKELKPRWKRCVELVDGTLGHDLGRRYVEVAYPAEAKAAMDALVVAVEGALARDIDALDWMTPKTKARARGKLKTMRNKVGYPKKWRDYAGVKVDRADLVASVGSARDYEFRRQLAKIGRRVDREDWYMTPPTVNAYYNPQMNDINFPAGILQPPFFDAQRDQALNLGGIGAVIGHELTHGFDDQGRKFDAKGNMEDWWTAEDAKAFEERAACFVDQYGSYESLPGVTLNGKLTLGENTADNGGLRVAQMALDAAPPTDPGDGFTARQRLFLGFSQVWCQNRTEAVARMLAVVDPHSAAEWRVNGPLSNMPEFAASFACKAGDRMVRPKPCRVW